MSSLIKIGKHQKDCFMLTLFKKNVVACNYSAPLLKISR